MDILNKINQLRNEKGWSIYKLAEEAEIPQATLSNMFARKTQPSLSTLSAICKAFGITLAKFFAEGQEEQSENQKELLFWYNKLTEKEQEAILNLVKQLQ